ncbi:helix-turn-helix domain-containing protein [Streptomyces sp. NPDC001100]
MQAIRGLVGEVADADPAVAVGVISSCKAEQKIPYRTACRALGVSESWFYKWRDRGAGDAPAASGGGDRGDLPGLGRHLRLT